MSIKKKLYQKLKNYYDDEDFAIGVISIATDDEDRKTIMKYMDEGRDVSVENIILLALELDTRHEERTEA